MFHIPIWIPQQLDCTGKCLYIDTEGTFRPERLLAVAERFWFHTILFCLSHSLDSSLQVWTPRQRCAGQCGICKGLQLWSPTDPPHTGEFHMLSLLNPLRWLWLSCVMVMQKKAVQLLECLWFQAAAMMSESRYAVVVVDSATALYRCFSSSLADMCTLGTVWHCSKQFFQ